MKSKEYREAMDNLTAGVHVLWILEVFSERIAIEHSHSYNEPDISLSLLAH